MADDTLRDQLIEESVAIMAAIAEENPLAAWVVDAYDQMYLLGDPVDYEPTADRTVAALAAEKGVEPIHEFYAQLLERDGDGLLMFPLLGYAHGNGDALHEMLTHPAAILGLADGGAHANFICDASTPTWMLTHWTRDRTRGPKLQIEDVIKKMSADTAALFELTDRGQLRPGLRADINVIDFDNLQLREPRLVADLPAGGTRLLQSAEGYVATIVAGQVTRENDSFTGARPGRLIRS